MSNKFMLYEGQEPYIFVSYSHKDKKQVMPILEKLSQNHYRFWYDQGIHPGTDWPEVVAERLQHAAVFLVILSKNYMKSQNCVREIHYAVAKEKKFLSVKLEEVQMTSGVEMQLCVSQAIDCGKYHAKESFYKELLGAKVLEECKMPVEVLEEEIDSKTEIREVLVENAGKHTKKKWSSKIMKGFVGVLALGIAFFGLGNAFGGKTVEINGQEFDKKASYVELNNMTLTAENMDTLLSFSELSSLKLQNCTFDSASAEKLGEFAELYQLEMISCKGARDYTFLENYKESLYTLVLDDMKLTSEDIQFSFVFDRLRTLEITNNPQVEDISGLTESMPHLEDVKLDNNSIEDVSVLSNYENLTRLSLKGNQIAYIDVPMKSLRIGSLNLSENPLISIQGMKDLTVLYNVQLENCLQNLNDTTGLACIVKSKDTIHELNLAGNGLAQELIDGLIVEGMALRKLVLDDNKLNNLRFMSGLQADMWSFSAQNNEIVSLEGLEKMKRLSYLDLSDNKIESIEALPAFLNESEPGERVSLDLRNNHISSLEGLESSQRFYALKLNGNKLSAKDALYLETLEGNYIHLDYFEEMPYDMMTGFATIYIKDVPQDKRVTYEDEILGCKFGFEDAEGNFIED